MDVISWPLFVAFHMNVALVLSPMETGTRNGNHSGLILVLENTRGVYEIQCAYMDIMAYRRYHKYMGLYFYGIVENLD